MEGIFDPVTREMMSAIGGYDRAATEFVRVTHQLLPPHVFHRFSPELNNGGKTPSGTPVFIQLLGGDPVCVAENADRAIELGAPGIDLNFGCPAKTVNRHDGGATLLKNPERLFDMVSSVKRACRGRVPVSAKVRLGFTHKEFVVDIAQAVAAAEAEQLTVHARTKLEGYQPPAHWEYIGKMKDAVKDLPIFANGDLWTLGDVNRCREVSGCQHVALGRAAFARPDLGLLIKGAITPDELKAWDFYQGQWLPTFMLHTAFQRSTHMALVRLKQWTKFLGRHFPEAVDVFDQVKRMQSFEEAYAFLKPNIENGRDGENSRVVEIDQTNLQPMKVFGDIHDANLKSVNR